MRAAFSTLPRRLRLRSPTPYLVIEIPVRKVAAGAATVSTTRRRITDPEVLERRRQALAKAREARAAKRASGS